VVEELLSPSSARWRDAGAVTQDADRRWRMTAKVGDRIVVESQKVGQAAREGEILEVVASTVGIRYEVRWIDGRVSTFSPSGGSVRIVGAPKRSRK
jgi:hypothetical protein